MSKYCRSCMSNAWVVIDHATRMTSCSECGFDLGYNLIKEENVDFAEIETGTLDDWTNSLFVNTTELNNASLFDDFLVSANGNQQKLGSDPVITAMCDRLGLSATVKNQAYENFKRVEHKSRVRDRNAVFAACIYVACRRNDMTWSIREIVSVANGAKLSDINKAIGVIAKTLNIEKNWLMRTKPDAFINRFCSSLGLGTQAVNAAHEAAKSFECINSRSAPLSVAAAVIYVVARLSDQKEPLKDIVEATGVAVATIRKTYRDLYPHLSMIIPKWFAEESDMKKLCIPRQRTRKISEKPSSHTQGSI